MKNSIFSKIFSGYLFITVALAVLIFAFSFSTVKSYYVDDLTEHIRNLAYSLKPQITSFVVLEEKEELKNYVKTTAENLHKRITVIDQEGFVLVDSEYNTINIGNHNNRPEVIQVIKNGFGKSLRYSSTLRQNMLFIAIPINLANNKIGILRLGMFTKDIDHLLANLQLKLFCVILLMILIAIGIALALSKNLSKPIQTLVNASRKVAKGDFSVKINLSNQDEIGELSKSFNHMTEKIRELFIDVSHKRNELDGILAAVMQGLLVLDENGEVVRANKSAEYFLKSKKLVGKKYWDLFHDKAMLKAIAVVNEEQKSSLERITHEDYFFGVTVTYIASLKSRLVLFHDITSLRKLEIMKKDFVSNVSHEMRTPLTSIKGFIETLEDEVSEEHKHYFEIIKKNAERLTTIVKDLLLMSEMEEKVMLLETEESDIKEIMANSVKLFEQVMKEKNLACRIDVKSEIPPIYVDSFKLEQVFINLIDNAIKYSEKGGVLIELDKTDEYLTIYVKDSGIGIPEEDLSRIFERFYVVDKSRSKQVGGTGLGLSIVKHIIHLHHGTIDVKSVLGQGTTFIIQLPLAKVLVTMGK